MPVDWAAVARRHAIDNIVAAAPHIQASYRAGAPTGRAGPNLANPRIPLHEGLLIGEPVGDGTRIKVHIEVDDGRAPHGKWLDDPPAVIYPRRGRYLSWIDRTTGQRIYARSVRPSRRYAGWWRKWVDGDLTRTVREG